MIIKVSWTLIIFYQIIQDNNTDCQTYTLPVMYEVVIVLYYKLNWMIRQLL